MREVSLWLPTRGYGMPGTKRYKSRACYVLFRLCALICMPLYAFLTGYSVTSGERFGLALLRWVLSNSALSGLEPPLGYIPVVG